MSLTVVILTKNEERHIARAIASVSVIADRCIVVDSGSTDRTVEIAAGAGAQILTHTFVTQAQQFNWALKQLPSDTIWVMRLDADEIVTDSLAIEIANSLPEIPDSIHGIFLSRRMNFLGCRIKWGGVFPTRVLRIFRHGHGASENRWMDEHIVVDGRTTRLFGEIVDDNLNSLTWWIEKHNAYASREVIDILGRKHPSLLGISIHNSSDSEHTSFKRVIKNYVYLRLPIGLRAFLYFLYRYVFRLGFLDGKAGTAFHVLQGLWYRYLVDMKLYETERYIKITGASPELAILDVLGVDVNDQLTN
jgi:glycosyltransferase involved in cell wall biosynthesis